MMEYMNMGCSLVAYIDFCRMHKDDESLQRAADLMEEVTNILEPYINKEAGMIRKSGIVDDYPVTEKEEYINSIIKQVMENMDNHSNQGN